MIIKPIGYILTDFHDKFGIPRQSGLIEGLKGRIILYPEYRNKDAFRDIEGFSHLWLLWEFSLSKGNTFSATVKPPRLGGKRKVGVFATRAPYRPNNIGLSCVKLEKVEVTKEYGITLVVSGVDMVDKTPIYDIKPYIPYTDCHPNASPGYTEETYAHSLKVEFDSALLERLPESKRQAAIGILEQDPRPAYDTDCSSAYGVMFAGFDIRFVVKEDVLTVIDVVKVNVGMYGEHVSGRSVKEAFRKRLI